MEEREERKKEKKKKRKRRQKLKDNTKGNTFLIFVFFFFGDHFRFGSVFIKKKPNRFFLKQKITTGSSLAQFG